MKIKQVWLGTLMGALPSLLGSYAVVSKNRVFIGKPVSGLYVFGKYMPFVIILWLLPLTLVYASKFIKSDLARVLGSLFAVLNVCLGLIFIEKTAAHYDKVFGSASRVSPGYSFWISLLGAVIIMDGLLKGWDRKLASAVLKNIFWIAVFILIFSGELNHISIIKEYFNNKAKFDSELVRHIILSLGTSLAALVIGIFLGYLAYRKSSLEKSIFTFLNTAQVIPTLSFIGLLMPPLGYLGENFELAKMLDIKGIGWAPAAIVLTAYALYPITRNVYAALKLIDSEIIEAAQGLGLSRFEIITKIEIPLALPLILAGFRVALVQASAGTIVAALVGAGGLGVFIFLGLAQTAQDLVMLGLIPIVLLSFAYTAALGLLEYLLTPRKGLSSA